MYEILPDIELLAAIRRGEQAAFKALFDRYYESLCKLAALKLNGNSDDAEEVVQKVFIDFWVRRKYESVETNVKGYLMSMVRNKAVDLVRSEQTRRNYEQSVIGDSKVDDNSLTYLEDVLRKEISLLPDQRRSIFVSVYLDGKKYKEVAEEHGISINTVKEQLRRAMARLRERMQEGGDIIIWILILLSPVFNHLND